MPISVRVTSVSHRAYGLRTYELPDEATVGDLREKVSEDMDCEPRQLKLLLSTSFLNNDVVSLSSLPLLQTTPVKFILPKDFVPRSQAASQAAQSAQGAQGTPAAAGPSGAESAGGVAPVPVIPMSSQAPSQVPAMVPISPSAPASAAGPAGGSVNAFGLPLQEGEEQPGPVPMTPADVLPDAEMVSTLCAVIGCTSKEAEYALKLANNNGDLAASLLTTGTSVEMMYNRAVEQARGRGRGSARVPAGMPGSPGGGMPSAPFVMGPGGSMTIPVHDFHTGEFTSATLTPAEEAEAQLSANPQLAQEFTAMVSRVSPDLALRLNEDHALLIDLYRLVAANVRAEVASFMTAAIQGISSYSQVSGRSPGERSAAPRPNPFAGSMSGSPAGSAAGPAAPSAGPLAGQDMQPQPQQPLALTPADRDVINNILDVVGHDLSFDLVARAYLQFDKDPDATLSVILDNREAFLP